MWISGKALKIHEAWSGTVANGDFDSGITVKARRDEGAVEVMDYNGLLFVGPRLHGGRVRRERERDFIAEKLRSRVKLSKIRRLLVRQGVEIAPATLYRFAAAELGFGRTRTTIPVADGEPGEEMYLDTGWMTLAGARRARSAAALPCMDLHAGGFALPLRLPVLRRDDRERDRGV